MQDSLENSESKMEFFTKYPQVKFYLVGTYFGLGFWVLKLTILLLIRLTKENGQIKL